MLDFVLLQKSQVFLRKAPLGMMALLVANIIDYAAELRMAIACQQKRPCTQRLRLMKVVEPFSMSRTTGDKAIDGFRPINRCV